jgi:hypothetical protein
MKKNLLLSLVIIFLFSIGAWAQTASLTVTIDNDLEDVTGPVEIPVYLEFTDPAVTVGSFDFIIQYDESVLTYTSALAGAIPAGGGLQASFNTPNQVNLAWAANPATSPIVSSTLTATDDLLLTLSFNAVVGTSSLTFIDKNIQPNGSAFYVGTASDTGQISTTFNDGFITIASAVPISMWAFFLMAGLIVAFLAFRVVRLF